MQPISYARHQFPAEIIRHAIWLYLRFTLSYRDVEELLAERGIETSYETVRRWVLKFGPLFARKLRRLRPRPMGTWHLDEMVTLSAKSGCDQLQGRKARRVRARGRPSSQRTTRETFMAAPIQTCWSPVLASPMDRLRRIPNARTPCDSVP